MYSRQTGHSKADRTSGLFPGLGTATTAAVAPEEWTVGATAEVVPGGFCTMGAGKATLLHLLDPRRMHTIMKL